MEQYINKSALVAEIERRVAEGEKVSKEVPSSAIMGLIQAYKNTLSFIDSLEVKEVDLEKEIEKYAYSLPHSATGATIYVSDIKSPIAREFGIKHDWSYEYVEQIAEHFFELGVKVQKGE